MNHDTFMSSLSALAGGAALDISAASPASMVLGSNVSLFNQPRGKHITPEQLAAERHRLQHEAARKRRR